MDTSFSGPDKITLTRVKTSAELNSFPDGTRFMLVYNYGYSVKIAALQWNLPRSQRYLLLEDNGVYLPLYNDQQLKEESLYLIPSNKA